MYGDSHTHTHISRCRTLRELLETGQLDEKKLISRFYLLVLFSKVFKYVHEFYLTTVCALILSFSGYNIMV